MVNEFDRTRPLSATEYVGSVLRGKRPEPVDPDHSLLLHLQRDPVLHSGLVERFHADFLAAVKAVGAAAQAGTGLEFAAGYLCCANRQLEYLTRYSAYRATARKE